MSLDVRPARAADLEAASELLVANGLGPARSHLAHVLRAGRMVVAATGQLGVLGFAASTERGGTTFLADCFVRPGRHGQGIGRRLLEALLEEPGPRWTFASGDVRALPLYVAFGMQPRAPMLYLRLAPADGARLAGAAPALERCETEEAAALDAEIFGRERPQDVAFWEAEGARAHCLRRAGRAVAYAWLQPVPGAPSASTHVGPAGGRTPDDARAVTLAAVALAAARRVPVTVDTIGPHPALADLLAAGARIVDRDTWLASTPLLDPERYVPSMSLG